MFVLGWPPRVLFIPWDDVQGMVPATFRASLRSQLRLFGNSSQTLAELCLLCDSQARQVDTEDQPSPAHPCQLHTLDTSLFATAFCFWSPTSRVDLIT